MANTSNVLEGPLRAPKQMLAEQEYGGHLSIHDDATAEQFDWQDTIEWMQRTQNLWPIEAGQRAALIDYLARNYNERSWGRRPALAPGLLPPAQ